MSGATLAVDASRAARRYIAARGGRVFIWFEDVNSYWMVQRVSTSAPPAGPAFDEYTVDDITVCLQRDFTPPETITLRLHPWWPLQPISVTGTGAGMALGADGGHGTSWPHHGGHGGDGGGGHGGGGHGH